MAIYLWVGLGGGIGAMLRFLVNSLAGKVFGHGFPWGTISVNIVGSFVMGVLIALMGVKWSTGMDMRVFLTTGILGGFTTFSAFSLDVVTIYERKEYVTAAIYGVGSVGISILALFFGMWLVRSAFA